jgi:spermidine synthase
MMVASLGGIVYLMRGLGNVPWIALAYGRRATTTTDAGEPLYIGEGRNSSIVISRLPAGQIYFHVSGKVEASTESFDMRLQRMLGHISALAHPDPKTVLIVGFGAGVTAGSFTTYSGIMDIVICELEKLIPPAATEYFRAENYNVMNDPRTTIHYDDARHFVLTTDQKFDIITSDPIHPWVKGAATLYSKEYFEECKRRLNPGGIVTQWVPLYESDLDTVRSEIATFFEVFPNGTIFANNIDGQGYDVVLLGQADPAPLNIDQIQARLDANPVAAESLAQVGIGTAIDLFANYAGSAQQMRGWLAGAQVNRDVNLRLQYLAGLGAIYQNAGGIMAQIVQFRQYPEGLFEGSEQSLARIRQMIDY